MTKSRAHTTDKARTEVLVGQVSTSVADEKLCSLVPGQFTASTLKSVKFPPGRWVVLSKSYGLVTSSPKSRTIISLLRLMAVSKSVSTDLLETSLFLRPQDSKFSLPYVHTAGSQG